MAIAPELRSYLENCKSQGLPFSAVSEQLLVSGWSQELLTEAEAWYTGHPSSLPEVSSVVGGTKSVKRHSSKPILILILGLIIFLLISGTASAYLVSNDKLPLPITKALYSLPFIPKSPKHILGLSAKSHQEVTKNSFNLSVAISSSDPSFAEVLGTGNLDLYLTGYSNHSDLKNPEASFTLGANKDLSMDVRTKNKLIYLKINKVPVFATAGLAIFGIKPDSLEPLLKDNWILIDSTTLDTPARIAMDSAQDSSVSPTPTQEQKELEKFFMDLLEQDVYPNLVMSKTSLKDLPVYKLVFEPTPELVDKISKKISDYADKKSSSIGKEEKASDSVKNLKFAFYIDQKSYLIHQMDTSMTITAKDSGNLTTSNVDIATVLQLSDFGRDLQIEIPEKAIPVEEFMTQVLNLSNQTPPPGI